MAEWDVLDRNAFLDELIGKSEYAAITYSANAVFSRVEREQLEIPPGITTDIEGRIAVAADHLNSWEYSIEYGHSNPGDKSKLKFRDVYNTMRANGFEVERMNLRVVGNSYSFVMKLSGNELTTSKDISTWDHLPEDRRTHIHELLENNLHVRKKVEVVNVA